MKQKIVQNYLIGLIGFLISLGWISCCSAQYFYSDKLGSCCHELCGNNDTARVAVKSPTGAMVRSLLFPGWGQLYNKKYIKAFLAFCAETGLVANSIYLNQQYKSSKTDLEKEFYINNRNLSNWWLVGVILFSMADAFVDAHLSGFDEKPDLSLITINPIITNNNSIGVQLSLCIQRLKIFN